MILRSLKIARAEIIPLASEKPSWEEVYEELDFSSILAPLSPEEPVLLNIDEEKEAAICYELTSDLLLIRRILSYLISGR